MPLIIYKSDGVSELWNSDNVPGGVLAHVKYYAPTATATVTFPVFAGRSVQLVNLVNGLSDPSITLDTALGYPRLTVSTATYGRRVAVVVY